MTDSVAALPPLPPEPPIAKPSAVDFAVLRSPDTLVPPTPPPPMLCASMPCDCSPVVVIGTALLTTTVLCDVATVLLPPLPPEPPMDAVMPVALSEMVSVPAMLMPPDPPPPPRLCAMTPGDWVQIVDTEREPCAVTCTDPASPPEPPSEKASAPSPTFSAPEIAVPPLPPPPPTL